MLKKAGTIVALATAGLLAMSPLALAGDRHHGSVDVTDQENEQESAQGNGILNGNNVLSGNAVQVCGVNLSAVNAVLGVINLSPVEGIIATAQGGGDCDNSGTAVGQSTTQDAENEND